MEGLKMKESKELAVGFIALAALLAEAFKDGAQVADVAVIFSKIQGDSELSSKLLAAYNGIELVSSELKDVSAGDVLDLVATVLPEIKKLLEAIKK